jgi:hypothetical protein
MSFTEWHLLRFFVTENSWTLKFTIEGFEKELSDAFVKIGFA